jgi:hypothetical protein
MTKQIGLVILGLLVVLGGGYYALRSLRDGQAIPTASAASIWVEVTSPAVSLVNASGSLQALNTGDEVAPGDTLESSATGRAIIHMPDGSTLRIEENSKLTLDKAVFNPQDESVIVEATLQAGRVWSKVVSLVTPESEWQVKTSNAVATVRGTSFGMEYKDKKSRVLVSEHKVKVNVIDPQTKKIVAAAERDVDQGKMIEIQDADVPAIALKPASIPGPVSIQNSPVDVRDWNSRNTQADKEVDEKINAIKKEGLSDKQVRTIMRQESKVLDTKVKELRGKKEVSDDVIKEIKKANNEEFQTRLKARVIEIKQEGGRDGGANKLEEVTKPTETTRDLSKPIKLEISGISNVKTINDGERIKVKAYLTYESGARRDVTEKVDWNITGDLGKVSEGVFTAKIPDQFSEVPEIKGTIQAQLKTENGVLSTDTINITVQQVASETVPIG